MKEKENTSTSNKKRMLYSVIVAVCALLLIAATVLTVYFLTRGNQSIVEKPPVIEDPNGDDPTGGENPGGENPGGEEPDDPTGGENPGGEEPNEPSGGVTVAFIKPVESTACSVEYNVVYNNTSLDKWYKHMAIDYVADAGAAVCAMADGVVKQVSMEEILGNYIVIEHEGGVTTLYRFVEPVDGLRVGDTVKRGQTIATIAEAYGTEYKDGTHLHLEMKVNGKHVDPHDYIDVTFEEK